MMTMTMTMIISCPFRRSCFTRKNRAAIHFLYLRADTLYITQEKETDNTCDSVFHSLNYGAMRNAVKQTAKERRTAFITSTYPPSDLLPRPLQQQYRNTAFDWSSWMTAKGQKYKLYINFNDTVTCTGFHYLAAAPQKSVFKKYYLKAPRN